MSLDVISGVLSCFADLVAVMDRPGNKGAGGGAESSKEEGRSQSPQGDDAEAADANSPHQSQM